MKKACEEQIAKIGNHIAEIKVEENGRIKKLQQVKTLLKEALKP